MYQLDTHKQSAVQLKEYVSLISHDLKAPIRHIKQFFPMLIEELTPCLTEEQREYKRYIDQSIALMSGKLEAIQSLACIHMAEPIREVISVSSLLAKALNRLSFNTTYKASIKLDVPDFLTCNVDQKLLLIVFTEVITNAYKFCESVPTPHVTICAGLCDGGVEILVTDNGMGIASQYHDDIFLPFRQLNHPEDSSSLGMGLTLAQAAMEQIGGILHVKFSEAGLTQFRIYLNSDE